MLVQQQQLTDGSDGADGADGAAAARAVRRVYGEVRSVAPAVLGVIFEATPRGGTVARLPPWPARDIAVWLLPLADYVGPPPDGVAPLDQFREILLLSEKVLGIPSRAGLNALTNDKLVRAYRHGSLYNRILQMVERDRWGELDAAVVLLSLSAFAHGVGIALRKRRTQAAAICHRVHAPIARAGARMESPAPDLFLPESGLTPRQLIGLFDYEPSASSIEPRGEDDSGRAALLFTPLLLHAPAARRPVPPPRRRLVSRRPHWRWPPGAWRRHLHTVAVQLAAAPPHCGAAQRDRLAAPVRTAAQHAACALRGPRAPLDRQLPPLAYF